MQWDSCEPWLGRVIAKEYLVDRADGHEAALPDQYWEVPQFLATRLNTPLESKWHSKVVTRLPSGGYCPYTV